MKNQLYQEFEKIKKKLYSKKDFFKKNLSSNNLHNTKTFEKKKNFLFLNDDLDNENQFSDDKTRIIFSNAFRKLAYKTQVFF